MGYLRWLSCGPGGLHTGDYLIADYAALKNNIDAGINQVKVHRVKEVVTSVVGSYQFPIAELRRESELKGVNFDAPIEVPDVVADEPDAAEYIGQIEDEENFQQDEVASGSGGPDAAPAEEAPHPKGSTPAGGSDERGKGEVVDGRKVRKYKGSTRPPGIMPEFWQRATLKDRGEAIAE